MLLAVGGVRYDRDGTPADKAGKPWPNLPATDKERAAVVAQAGKLSKPPEIIERTGADADVRAAAQGHAEGALGAPGHARLLRRAKDSQEREHLFRPDDFLMGAGRPQRPRARRRGTP